MAGKGSSPKNCFSKEFKNNYDLISWDKNISCWKCEGKGEVFNLSLNIWNICPICKNFKKLNNRSKKNT